MPLVLVGEARECPAVGQAEPALGTFEGLNVGLLVDAQHERALGRVEVQPDDVGRLGGELGVRADAPAPSPAQADPVAPQGPPYLVRTDVAQVGREERAGPGRVARRRRCVEGGEDALLGRGVVADPGPGTGRVDEATEAVARETGPPLAHPGRPRRELAGDLVGSHAVRGSQDDPGPLHDPLLARPGPQPGPERLLLSLRQHDGGGGLPHARSVYHDALHRN